jgi:hypothetical protein
MNLTCNSRFQCHSSARTHNTTWWFCYVAFTVLPNSSTWSLKFAHLVVSVQINAQACAQQPHSTKINGTTLISLKNYNARWCFEDACQECQSWLYLLPLWFASHLHLQSETSLLVETLMSPTCPMSTFPFWTLALLMIVRQLLRMAIH